MNSGIKFFVCLFAITSCLSYACVKNTEQQRIFEYYAKAALFELCNTVISKQCTEVNEKLSSLSPEFYFFEKDSRKEVLVLFSLSNSHPSVILSYDKDGLLKVVDRGNWLVDKLELIKIFEEGG